MDKIIHKLESQLLEPFNNYNTLFLDIETDGLSHKNKLVIIGLILFNKDDQNPILIQLFNDDYMSEREMLLELLDIIKDNAIDYFISFNGNSFDLPFLNARLKHYKIDFALNKAANVDLLRLVRTHQAALNLPDYKLKSIEKFVGIDRMDTISGKDSIIMYHAYIETHSEAIKRTILLHNYDDLVNMIPLLKITESMPKVINPFKILFKRKWYLSTAQLKANRLNCSLVLDQRLSIADLYYEANGIHFECQETHVQISFDTIALTDPNNNHYHFIDSQFVTKLTLDQLNDAHKKNHLVAYNKDLLDENITNRIFEHIDCILNLILEN